MLAEDARHQVAVGARRQRHDDADRPARIGLRSRNADAREQHDRERNLHRERNTPQRPAGLLHLHRPPGGLRADIGARTHQSSSRKQFPNFRRFRA
jgi:hypothetical protein